VTVNHAASHSKNSDRRREENRREETQGLSVSDEQGDDNLITLDQEGFLSGRYYWEVDLKDTNEWTLGIYEENGSFKETSEPSKRIFRVLERKGSVYRALICSQNISQENPLQVEKCPEKIVIFLDYEDRDISFYNMTDGTYIFSFPKASFLGTLYPYFKRKSM
jgi:butyrophilin